MRHGRVGRVGRAVVPVVVVVIDLPVEPDAVEVERAEGVLAPRVVSLGEGVERADGGVRAVDEAVAARPDARRDGDGAEGDAEAETAEGRAEGVVQLADASGPLVIEVLQDLGVAV